jgi:hypothetical protein
LASFLGARGGGGGGTSSSSSIVVLLAHTAASAASVMAFLFCAAVTLGLGFSSSSLPSSSFMAFALLLPAFAEAALPVLAGALL